MSGRKIILAFCLMCFVSVGSREQQPVPAPPKPAAGDSHTPQAVPPPPKPAAGDSYAPQPAPPLPKPAPDSPGLDVTMEFIQDRLSAMGPIMYMANRNGSNGAETCLVELTNVVADQQRCTIGYHTRIANRYPNSIRLGFCGPTPTFGRLGVAVNTPEVNFDTVLDLKEVKKITVVSHEQILNDHEDVAWTIRPPIFQIEVYQTRNKGGEFNLDDEELANRLARAINHAVELCTPDKKPEPF